ncbi:riboflavin kinase [Tothia fuscella]|uniref:Riboflavin kinase n=1 Tax=Tothia fuscella TaxID=1048955 RepID=A0A9P4NQL4_9PEZI|nr:riboflavin kinase [Tothia fuscella]
MRPDGPRDAIAGPNGGPEHPFPLRLSGKVIKGFGRGSKELGIPTANIPLAGLTIGGEDSLDSGIYYGWAGLEHTSPVSSSSPASNSDSSFSSTSGRRQSISDTVRSAGSKLASSVGSLFSGSDEDESRGTVYPMVMSVGWNPFYKNTVRSVEVHIIHHFPHDFYGRHLNLAILGFIRPEYDYVDKDSLIDDIRTDIEVAKRSLERPAYKEIMRDKTLLQFPDPERGDKDVASL